MRKVLFSLTLVVAAAALASQPSWALDTNFKVFGGLSYISPLGDEDVDFGAVSDSVEASNQLGWTVGFEWKFIKRIGIEVDAVNAKHDIEFDGDKIAEIGFTPVSASLNFHVINTKIVDLYIAPTATYVIWGDLDFESGLSVSLDDENADNDFAYGASVGLDIGLGEHFAIFGGVRWLNLDIAGDNIDDISVDPLLSRLGVAFRF